MHAHDVIADLIETIVRTVEPVFGYPNSRAMQSSPTPIKIH